MRHSPEKWAEYREHWSEFLDEFDREMYVPVFKPRGYSKNSAIQVFLDSYLRNDLSKLIDILDERLEGVLDDSLEAEDEGEEWKRD